MRWKYEYDEIQYDEMRAVGYAASGADARVITDSHNADIAALEAELARVKTESLRVVPVPAADHGLMYDWYMTPTGLGYPGKDRKQNNCIESAEGYYRLDECTPVRIKRWEPEQ